MWRLSLTLLWILLVGCTGKHQTTVPPNGGSADEANVPAEIDKSLRVIRSGVWVNASLGPWKCFVPKEEPGSTLVCTKGKRFVVEADDHPNSFSVSIPERQDFSAILTLTDSQKNGDYERLNYVGLSKQGTVIRGVVDENLDGQIDRMADFGQKKTSAFIDGSWTSVENIGRDEDGKIIYEAVLNGSVKRVVFDSFPYQVVEVPLSAKSSVSAPVKP